MISIISKISIISIISIISVARSFSEITDDVKMWHVLTSFDSITKQTHSNHGVYLIYVIMNLKDVIFPLVLQLIMCKN